jgi:hypothetical protein
MQHRLCIQLWGTRLPKTVTTQGSGKRHPLSMRTTKEVRDQLEAAAGRAGRSLAQELEFRLEASIARQEYLIAQWGEDIYNICESMARSLWHIERYTGKRWLDDDETFHLFAESAGQIIKNFRDLVKVRRRETPEGPLADKTVAELAGIFAALGGISPPRPLPPGPDRDKDAARAAANRESWLHSIAKRGSRPIDDATLEVLLTDPMDADIAKLSQRKNRNRS